MRHTSRSLFRVGLALVATAVLGALPVVTPRPPLASALTPVVPRSSGYWLVGGDGSIYPFGSASDRGSLRGTRLTRPVVGIAPTASGNGYWMVASDGGIFSFGDAPFYGSTGAITLNQPIVGMAATPTGRGYWFVAADGGIFAFGDAAFHGSTGAMKLNKPIVGMAATPTGKGYWFVASDGGIFNFGDAAFLGSVGGESLPAGIVVMAGGLLPSPGATPSNPAPTSATTPTTGPAPSGQAFEIAVVGDSGYAAPQYPIFDRVVDHMNSVPLAFVVHAGDFKDPTSACTDSRFGAVRDSFNKSKAPFVYTPGDNDWMECSLNANNPMDPVERLNELREMFFAQDESLGANRMPLSTQRQQGYPENTRWTKEGVVFATINAPGPNDNLDYNGGSESGPRRIANRAWLRQTFEYAQATNATAVMIIWQVDGWQPKFRRTWDYLMNWPDDSAVPDSQGPELKQLAQAFGKPVVLVHGDTHVFRIDQGGWATPRPDGSVEMVGAWTDVPNFTRVETYAGGSFSATQPEVHPEMWLRVTVDPTSPRVFTFTSEQAP